MDKEKFKTVEKMDPTEIPATESSEIIKDSIWMQ